MPRTSDGITPQLLKELNAAAARRRPTDDELVRMVENAFNAAWANGCIDPAGGTVSIYDGKHRKDRIEGREDIAFAVGYLAAKGYRTVATSRVYTDKKSLMMDIERR